MDLSGILPPANAVPHLVPLPVLIPAAAAAACLLAGRHPRIQRMITASALTVLIVLCTVLVALVDRAGIQVLQIGGWDAPVGITLVADRLSTLLLAVSSLVLFSVLRYAIGQGVRDGTEDEPVGVFLPAYLLLTMGVNMAFLAGDMFNLYVGFEVLLVASYVLLTIGASPARVRAGVSYVMVSMLSSFVFLIALALIYAAVGTMNMAQISVRMESVPEGTRAAIFAVLLIAFGIKAAVFPLYSWLPDSYPTAPALVTAVFAGLLTKVGVYSIIRVRSVVFTDGRLDGVLMWAALLTMLVGILGAMAQNDIKRLLSFTLVSHIGYMIMGVSLGTATGLSGAIFYTVHHILVQTALFLVVGLIERQAGSSSLRRLGSLAYVSPLLAVLYLVPALNLGGVPPFSGFLGKIILVEAAAGHGGTMAWVLVAGAVATSLLTLYTMTVVWSKAFWRDRSDAPDGATALAATGPLAGTRREIELAERADVGRMPFGMVAPTVLLVVASLSVSVLAGPISAVTGRSAESAQDVAVYRRAVLGPGYLGPGRTLVPGQAGPVAPGEHDRVKDGIEERRSPAGAASTMSDGKGDS
ncbi:Na+/H+ antiporter subunit D [Corynebacterium pygosceleis]|uniref:Na+/H+ antiporter subunit D n=1 Tax=Corynebacterium pygosceleis TaxID=2800406 RepID=A0A9Q4GJ48_9CORY|nr:Na+/H+ antiporter subunit D [Corynebacterium pygosceleis]MCK7638390.1 Na+/H+ antiporter subunit D [Corynebacterium pygosceleis]MCK7675370.1 Na+/H+ antiporter subunit D [Corynebacterium pygosceleis]MCL0121236.1 Na+/H+ antiporter subunit D [Corynebacterium pygosceleis]MCX7445451.1 Na+/H+ antiporter subunit D [Corynebacterium pygosceleis]MCX7469053.1 Na+/H+ antiporter subunit D [Corynebacterium pygosceleis]